MYILYCRVLLQVCPLYIAEIAPPEKRGVLGAFVNSFSTTGSVVRSVVTLHVIVQYGWSIIVWARYTIYRLFFSSIASKIMTSTLNYVSWMSLAGSVLNTRDFNYRVTIHFQVGTLANVAIKDVLFGWRIVLSLHFLCGIFLASAALLLPETPR